MQEIYQISDLKGAGDKTCALLRSLNINTPQDLLFHLPYRYQDKTKFTPIANFIVGEFFLAKAKLLKTEIKFTGRRTMLVWVEDETQIAVLKFFYFSASQQKAFSSSQTIEFFGEARYGNNCIEMVHPETNLPNIVQKSIIESSLTPVYPTTKGLHQRTIRNLVSQVLQNSTAIETILPNHYLQSYGFDSLSECLLTAHKPPIGFKILEIKQARNYLAFEELVAHHFALKKVKQRVKLKAGVKITATGKLRLKCLENLPFKLTGAQIKVINEILQDLNSSSSMQRLLQGDVGSGKTLVAIMAGLQCVEAGFQCALMAPTEILTGQHYQNIKSLVEPIGVNCQLLTSKLSTADKKTSKHNVVSGVADFIIGTHALIQAEVEFNNLGLVIVDEQHKFGVGQRNKLSSKVKTKLVNQLIMTATPIPRTLAMSFYAFLDYSLIDELPPGRTNITTTSLPEDKRDAVIKRLNQYCADGKQAYWVCPLIEDSETLQCQTATETYQRLQNKLPKLKIGLVHGKIKDKNTIMQGFKDRNYDILVATTVIEVGVDVPNASLMIIDNAERLGLSQLHQLRGRVGRGEVKSYCMLLYKKPWSRNAKSRIEIMLQTNDGFKIAERDLAIRGPGELLGKHQAGDIKFKLADFTEDQAIIQKIVKISPELEQVCNFEAQQRLINRWRLGNSL